MSSIAPSVTAKSGRNWTRETRRSAPARLARNALLSPASGGLPVVDAPRQRHEVLTQVHRRNAELLGAQLTSDTNRRRVRRKRSKLSLVDGESQSATPLLSTASKLSRMGTSDWDQNEDDTDSDSSYNSFNLSLQKKALFEPPTEAGPTLLSEETLKQTSSAIPKSMELDRTVVYRVYRSHYEGEYFQDGNLSAQLYTGTNRRLLQRELSNPLFRWVHIENRNMNFNSFQSIALQCPWLSENERDSLEGILRVARQKSDRSLRLPEGKKGNYVEPEYFEETIKQTVFHGFRSRKQHTGSVRWMCVPYFVVGEKEPKKLVRRATSFKPHELPDFENLGQFTDSGYTLQGKYYQVAQLWVVMLGDGLLITCARKGVSDLAATGIDINSLPPAGSNRLTGDRAPIILVSDGGVRTWLLPLDYCRTWPEFESNFAEINVDFSEGWNLIYQDTKITRHDWPSVLKLASKASIRLSLEKKDEDEIETEDEESSSSSSDDEEVAAERAEGTHQKAQNNSNETDKRENVPTITMSSPTTPRFDGIATKVENDTGEAWHIFSLMATDAIQITNASQTSLHSVSLPFDARILEEDMNEINLYLSATNKRLGESDAYNKCRPAMFQTVKEYANSMEPRPDDSKHVYHHRIQFVKAARDILSFFFPPDVDHAVIGKYWGAVLRILQDESVTKSQSRFHHMVRNLHNLSHNVRDLKDELFSKRNPSHNQTNVPHEFIQAFLMCEMYFILYTTDQANRSRNYLRRCKALLNQGKTKVIQGLQTVSLRDKEAVSPLGVATQLLGQLLQDVGGGPLFPDRHQLASDYWDYIQKLTTAVQHDPLSRKFQEKFVFLKSELESILSTLEDQQRVLVALDDSIAAREAKSVSLDTIRHPGREASVIEFGLHSTEETLQNFGEMARRTADLESWHFRMVESNKDRQEKAALAFTTVTVLFLPVTLLASVFGMNSNDIRNMEQGQWLFWVIAAPLCVFGMAIWLAYLGSLSRWWRALKHVGKHDDSKL